MADTFTIVERPSSSPAASGAAAAYAAAEPSAAGSAAAGSAGHHHPDVSGPLVNALAASVQAVLDSNPTRSALLALFWNLNRLHDVFDPTHPIWWTPEWEAFAWAVRTSMRGYRNDINEALAELDETRTAADT